MSPLSSSIVAPAVEAVSQDLNITSRTIGDLCVSVYILGSAFGPFVMAPMSEIYGRVPVLQVGMLFYAICNACCGFTHTAATLIVLRLLAGLGGSAPLVIGTGVIRYMTLCASMPWANIVSSDCWPPGERGKAVSTWALGPLLGPALGPLVGAFIVSQTTWRWVFWSTSFADILIQALSLVLLPETYTPAILKRKLKALKLYTNNQDLHLAADMEKEVGKALLYSFMRPMRMLGSQFIIQLVALYMAYVSIPSDHNEIISLTHSQIFGLFYLILTSFPSVWEDIYKEKLQLAGLNYLSLGIGYLLGALVNGRLNDKIYLHLKTKNGGNARPEFRVPLMIIGSILMPLGLFWYGWTARSSINWVVPNIGIGIFACGSVFCLQCMQAYIIDCYTKFAASAIAAAVLLRSLAGFVFPLFSSALYDRLGLGLGTSVLAVAGIVVGIPGPLIFWKFGANLRQISTYTVG
jgi:MFS family permease